MARKLALKFCKIDGTHIAHGSRKSKMKEKFTE